MPKRSRRQYEPEFSVTQKVDRRALDELTETGRHTFGTVGPYRLKRILGKGGSAIVYLATKEGSPDIALKVFNESSESDQAAFARFLRESQAVSRLREHPHVITAYDTGEEDGNYYIAMELVPGGRTLKDLLVEKGVLGRHQALGLGIAIAKALSYAHRLGYVHRDVKPQNVLINEFGVPLLSDFGLVRCGVSNLTQHGELLGTPVYMAPEQLLHGSRDATPQTDLYGLGMILYEMLVGSLPYGLEKGMDYKEILKCVQTANPLTSSPSGWRFGRDLEGILGKLLERHPEDRYHSAEELVADLEKCRDGRPVELRLPGWSDRFEGWAQGHRIVTLCVLLTALCAGLFTLFYFERKEAEMSEAVLDELTDIAENRQVTGELAPLAELYPDDVDDILAGSPMYLAWEHARLALKEGRLENAQEYFLISSELAREQSDRQLQLLARIGLARLMVVDGRFDEARTEFLALAASQPRYSQLWELCIFEAGVSVRLDNDRSGAERLWEILRPEFNTSIESSQQKTYIAILSEFILGTQDRKYLERAMEAVPESFQALGFWCMALMEERAEQKEESMARARDKGKGHFVWMVKEIP